MKDFRAFVSSVLSRNASVFTDLSDRIWELAELSLKETKSAGVYCELLEQLGFTVEKNLAGLPTAFLGKFGEGRPYIGILGEFDALSGLSQVGGAVEKKPLTPGGNGHGCGHNLLGAGALASAYAVKEYLRETKESGTVIFYGTPGEEGGSGKAQMAKMGYFADLDVALTWHPGDCNEVVTGTCNSCIQTLYQFHGVSSHAAGDPENGRSALDAVELMNVGVQYLREHMKPDGRIHYAMINGGGISPNVVQSEASVLYMVRSVRVKDARLLQARVDDIAHGASLMTGTTFEKIFIDGCSDTVPNHALEQSVYEELCRVKLPVYTEEEMNYAKAVRQTVGERIPSLIAEVDENGRKTVETLSDSGKKPLNDFVSPLWTGDYFSPGSTDVGDVSWLTPAVQLYTACFVSGSPGHSWQNVSCGKTSIGHKGMLLAGEVLANTAISLLQNPERLSVIRREWAERTKDGYDCPIPDGESVKALQF